MSGNIYSANQHLHVNRANQPTARQRGGGLQKWDFALNCPFPNRTFANPTSPAQLVCTVYTKILICT